MSFNHKEIAHAAAEIQAYIDAARPAVRDVTLVEFALPYALADLNWGILLEPRAVTAGGNGEFRHARWLLVSLKSPWLGVFLADARRVRPVKKAAGLWHRSFGQELPLPEFQNTLTGQLLLKAEAVANDRILNLQFSSTERITFELFSSRPNWHIDDPGFGAVSWRPSAAKVRTESDGTGEGPEQMLRLRMFRDRFAERPEGQQWFDAALAFYEKLRQTALLEHLKRAEERRLHAELKSGLELVAGLRESLKKSEKAEQYRAWGEMLKGGMHEFPRDYRGKTINVYGVDIPLDESMSLSENLTRLFARAKKFIRTQQEVKPRLEQAVAQVAAARTALQRIQALRFNEPFADSFAKLKELVPELGKEPPSEAVDLKRKKQQKRLDEVGLKSFESKEKLKIWVGRNHSQNEELVMRLARGNDLWFHLKGRPGAHVVVQVPAGKTASLETLLDAATLVAHYSGVKEGDKVEVDYTFRKFVKRVSNKSKGAGDVFLVTYSQNKSLMVRIEDSRLTRLLAD